MIYVQLDRNRTTSLRMTGHALTAPHGQDLVCAAVSVLAINTANSLETLVGLKPPDMVTDVQDGDFSLQLRTDQLTHKQKEFAFLLLDSFTLGIESLQESYPASITYREGGGNND